MDRFVKAATTVADGRRRQHAERACQHRGLVRQDVAEQVLGQDDVEIARSADQVHCGRVDQHVFECHIREFIAHQPCGHFAPQARSLQHVRLVDLRDVPATPAREAPGNASDALDLSHGIGTLVHGAVRLARLAAEIQAAGELAHEQQVHAVEDFGLDGGGIAQRGHDLHGPQVGVDAQLGAQPEQGGLRPDRRRRAPLRAAYGAQQHAVGLAAQVQGGRRQAVTVQVYGDAPEGRLGQFEIVPEARCDGAQHAQPLGDDLRPDAITGQDRDMCLHCACRAS